MIRNTLFVASICCLAGCFNASVTQSNGGGGRDASSCISIANPEGESGIATVSNSCDVAVNFLEFSTGSQGLVTIDPMSEVQLEGFIFAWGACVAPFEPDRIAEFDFQCVS